MTTQIADNWKTWTSIKGDIGKSAKHRFDFLQPADLQDLLDEAALQFVLHHDGSKYTHTGQAIVFANKCLSRGAVEVSKPIYGPRMKARGEDAEVVGGRIDFDAVAYEIAAPEEEEEDPRIAELEIINPRVALIIRMYRAGYTRREVALALGVTPAQISYDLRAAAKIVRGRKQKKQMSLFVAVAPDVLNVYAKKVTRSGRPVANPVQSAPKQIQLTLFS
jgi:uncharacterized protein (DUF433 family)